MPIGGLPVQTVEYESHRCKFEPCQPKPCNKVKWLERICWILAVLLALSISAHAQVGGGGVNTGNAVALQGTPISSTPPSANQLLKYTGGKWTPSSGGGGGCSPAGSAGQVLFDDGAGGCTASSATVSGSTFTATLSGNSSTATALAANPADCSANQFANAIAANGDLTCSALTLAGAQFANQGTTTTLLHGNAAGNPSFSAVVTADLNITTTSCTNQVVTAISSGAGGTCTTMTLASAQFANQGTTTTVLHGNGAGNPSFSAVVTADLNITTTSCTNQFVTAISSGAGGTCTTATLASAQYANQGTTTTVLHGNGAGNPSWAAVSLANDVTGTLATASLAADAKVRVCEYTIGAPGAASAALADDNDLLSKCRNKYGSTLTVQAVQCYADAGSPTVMVTVTGGADTLTGNLTCGTASWASGTLSGTPTVASDGSLDLKIVSAGGTAKSLSISVKMTL